MTGMYIATEDTHYSWLQSASGQEVMWCREIISEGACVITESAPFLLPLLTPPTRGRSHRCLREGKVERGEQRWEETLRQGTGHEQRQNER